LVGSNLCLHSPEFIKPSQAAAKGIQAVQFTPTSLSSLLRQIRFLRTKFCQLPDTEAYVTPQYLAENFQSQPKNNLLLSTMSGDAHDCFASHALRTTQCLVLGKAETHRGWEGGSTAVPCMLDVLMATCPRQVFNSSSDVSTLHYKRDYTDSINIGEILYTRCVQDCVLLQLRSGRLGH
ncbi:hypothetical protein BD309DRAFT_1073674, partial [Dichomitus squalens]